MSQSIVVEKKSIASDASIKEFESLIKCSDSLDKIPVFAIDGSLEKNLDALKFLKKFNFVCVTQSDSSFFNTNCQSLKQVQLSGHKAYAFLHQKNAKSDSFQVTAESQLLDLLDKEMADFIPDATAHSQEAWNLRCDRVLRQFFSSIYTEDGSDIADQLLPTIESLMQCDSTDLIAPFSLPTIDYNPTWSRAPHVISAYHLHAHYVTLQAYYSEYVEQTLSKKASVTLEANRNKQRWLHRLQRELISTAKKVILGKRATNQMVQDAAFHSKKETCDEKDSIEAMRPLQSGYEAFVALTAASIELVPGFEGYYPFYLACRRAKWSTVGADCITVTNDDEYSKAIFEQCSVKVQLEPGTVLITSRTTPRWLSPNTKCTLLPLSYRWQKHNAVFQDAEFFDDNRVLELAQICPFELALNAIYQKSIFDGIVFTSLPHLTGAAQQFQRSTKKTSQSLKIQRQQIYDAWLASLPKKADKNLSQYHYQAPKIDEYLINLISYETQLLGLANESLQEMTTRVEDEEKEESGAKPSTEEKMPKKRKRDQKNAQEFDFSAINLHRPMSFESTDCEMSAPESIFHEEPLSELENLMLELNCLQ